jgi:THO complex subunit 2
MGVIYIGNINKPMMNLSRLIEKSISSAYDIVHQAHFQSFGSSSGAIIDAMDAANSSVRRSFVDLPSELFQMLACAGPYLYRDTLLLQKVFFFSFLILR